MTFSSLPQFYTSDVWRKFRRALIDERRNPEDGILYSEYSGKPLLNGYDIVLHHIDPLTMRNVNDYSVSLNPDNIQIVSIAEHNIIHARFGYAMERKVYIVHGAPCSGKTTFVASSRGNSDLVVDMDAIWQCVTGGQLYHKPDALKPNVFGVRNCLLDMIRTRYPRVGWERAWIIAGLPNCVERERMAVDMGAELIHIDTDRVTCLERLAADDKRAPYRAQWEQYIEDYFAQYTP